MGKCLEPGADRPPPAVDFPDDEAMRISHEALYQALGAIAIDRPNGRLPILDGPDRNLIRTTPTAARKFNCEFKIALRSPPTVTLDWRSYFAARARSSSLRDRPRQQRFPRPLRAMSPRPRADLSQASFSTKAHSSNPQDQVHRWRPDLPSA
jgi:hypothetical protein